MYKLLCFLPNSLFLDLISILRGKAINLYLYKRTNAFVKKIYTNDNNLVLLLDI